MPNPPHGEAETSDISFQVLKLALEHSWAHFLSHATQRLTTMRFFLVIFGALAAAFVAATNGSQFGIAAGIAFVGLIMTGLFYLMDCRNVELIKISEAPLVVAQCRLATLSGIVEIKMMDASNNSPKKRYRYSTTFPLFFSFSAFLSVGALIVAARNACG